MRDSPAILLCGRGPASPAAAAALSSMREGMSVHLPDHVIETAYLHGGDRSIVEGLATLRDQGATQIVCVPATVFAGGEVKLSLTAAVNAFTATHTGIDVLIAKDPAIEPKTLRAAAERLDPVIAATDVPVHEIALVVIGPGGADTDANADVAKVARMLWEGAGVGWTEVCYLSLARPGIAESLAHASRLGFKQIVVLPYLLVEDDRIATIGAQVDTAAVETGVPIVLAPALGTGDLLAAALADRVRLAVDGGSGNAMNCQLCTYREQVLGAEHNHDHHLHHDHTHESGHTHSHESSHARSHDHDHEPG